MADARVHTDTQATHMEMEVKVCMQKRARCTQSSVLRWLQEPIHRLGGHGVLLNHALASTCLTHIRRKLKSLFCFVLQFSVKDASSSDPFVSPWSSRGSFYCPDKHEGTRLLVPSRSSLPHGLLMDAGALGCCCPSSSSNAHTHLRTWTGMYERTEV